MHVHWLLLGCFLAPLCHATTWGETSVDDPILPGAKCQVQEPNSYGGYIYWWPSKYDQVFWPFTERHGIWHCRQSGFTAFIGDFNDMPQETIAAVREFLAKAYPRPDTELSFDGEVALLEGIAALRKPDEAEANYMLRALAYQYEEQGNLARARQYRERALADIEKALAGELPAAQRRSYLIVAAGYRREFGDVTASDAHLSALRMMLAATSAAAASDDASDSGSESGSAADAHEGAESEADYFRELLAGVARIEPGGRLAPASEEGAMD